MKEIEVEQPHQFEISIKVPEGSWAVGPHFNSLLTLYCSTLFLELRNFNSILFNTGDISWNINREDVLKLKEFYERT